ncbi:MAG TPA: endonuclease/exonuclease/phosphatase family protein [Pyrinomonadaceae bacterium]|nr:endonuclease/exonuclease/phosphatase family protein [Pyrinomonadaceae bacterium]
MPIYYSIDGSKESEKRIAKGLLRLKEAFVKEDFPKRNIEETLLLATWNIREFDSTKYGARGKEPIFYIAEIINQFDLVAVQEVRDDLTALNKLMRYLGGWWKVLLTDVTEGTQGNRERMAFVYDSRKLSFGGLAGEIVVPPVRKKGADLQPAKQLARTPFLVGFRAGWFKFTICTTHILYGEETADDPNRIEEIRVLANFLAEQAEGKYAWAKNMILLGDFNIFDTTDETMKAITSAGFVVPPQLQKLPSNAPRSKHYDQVAFIAPDIRDQLELCKAGVFNYYEHVYRADEESVYADDMGKAYTEKKDGTPRDKKERTRYYNDWRTFQMSDHLPMWIELKIDFGKEYLDKKIKAKAKAEKTPETVLLNTPS